MAVSRPVASEAPRPRPASRRAAEAPRQATLASLAAPLLPIPVPTAPVEGAPEPSEPVEPVAGTAVAGPTSAVPTLAGATSATAGGADASSGASGGGRSEHGQGGYEFGELDEIPQVLQRPSKWDFASYYPEEERRLRREADVKVELLVDETGTVIDVVIVEGAGRNFDAAARKLGHVLRFTPGRRRGRPVKMRAFIVFNFKVENL